MDDKSIRKILIAYLKAVSKEVRIFEEKSIGNSICDIMAVTDFLIGYEIKSDLDNYQRLERQIQAYDRFFDKNYIVVSKGHLSTISERVPEHWGIICILKEGVDVSRAARLNPKVSRRSQLSILWKLELKNLLVRNDLPAYAQKDKGYIADQIVLQVPDKKLQTQIARELMERDYSVFDAKDYTTHSVWKEDSELPTADWVDMLSEKDLSEYTLDKWIALYQRAKVIRDEKETQFHSKINDRPEHAIPYTDIEVYPGVPWVSANIINDFALYLLDIKYSHRLVSYEPITGVWCVHGKTTWCTHNRTAAEVKYGLKRYNALFILEATLNLREIKLYDGSKYNEADTIAALEKQRIIIEEFKKWIWEDEDRRWQVEEAYNNMFAEYGKVEYDGSKRTFPGMSDKFRLYDYQKDAVERIVTTPNTLLAFDVGAGKTYIMIAAAMELRNQGISRKNMFVVPNNIVGQWEKIFSELYPQAKILAIEPKSFKPAMRSKVLEQVRDGDYDGIIIAYSCFEMIPLSEKYILSNLENQLREIDEAIQKLKNQSRWQWGDVPLGRQRQYIARLTQDFLDRVVNSPIQAKPDVSFDMLEINTLFLDEAHNYKNLPIRTKLKGLRGINTVGSKKCADMLEKVRCVQKANGGRGVVFATGTPLCNSIADAYVMQTYLQYDELCRNKLNQFDNWIKTFASLEQLCEIDVDTSQYRMVRRFARFFNLPELASMFSQIAVFHAMDETDGVPAWVGYTDVLLPKNEMLSGYMRELTERTELIRSGKADVRKDNMLKVSTDGRKAALDLTLVNRKQSYDETSKTFCCVQRVKDIYEKYDGCSQLIFCDYSTPKGKTEFNVYQTLKDRLVEQGIPKKEIAFVHSYRTESRRLKLYEEVNSGKIRVLIGSTFKLGIGANVQTKLKAIHHLDVPWRPADMVQREGRILRRGNENDEIFIFRYIAEGSFDAYMWQVLESKQRFIAQFLNGNPYQRSTTDLENSVLSYAEVKALALSQPLMKQLAEKENELKKLKILQFKSKQEQNAIKKELERLTIDIPKAEARYFQTKKNKEHVDALDLDAEFKKLKSFTAELAPEKLDAVGQEKTLLSVLDFSVICPAKQPEDKPYVLLERSGVRYMIQTGNSAAGNLRRLVNFFRKFETMVKRDAETVTRLKERRRNIENQGAVPDGYSQQVAECEKEIEHLRAQIVIA